MSVMRDYLNGLLQARAVGVAETSGYPALKTLFDSAGTKLNPKVELIVHPRNAGAGNPDGGLFTQRRARNLGQGDLFATDQTIPDRGAVEVKSTAEPVAVTAQSTQALKYLSKYGHLLITNYYHFALYRLNDGQPELIDEYKIADSEAAFWKLAERGQQTAKDQERNFLEFLTRICLTGVPLDQPKIVASFLASYAREALAEVENSPHVDDLDGIKVALETALGITFKEEGGRHFFHSTLVQTVFYGLFSGWVLWHESNPSRTDEFRTVDTFQYLRLPAIEPLFKALTGSQLRQLGLQVLMDRAVGVLKRVERGSFFRSFEVSGAVQYFYEPFLEAFDPELRKEFGVWYTPVEIVRYMVGRVDQLLISELGIADELADPNVVILDPCCGTGAYLVETLRLIKQRLIAKYGPALAPSLLKKAAMNRVIGFELLPAPFVVSHLQLGMGLAASGAALNEDERAAVYLTNALTGWEPMESPKLNYFQFKEEYDASQRVKQSSPILVIIGNPPYDGYTGVTASEEEQALSDAYRNIEGAPAAQGHGLNDLYVRFFRMAEKRVTSEHPGFGIVSFISNYKWLDSTSCPGMRKAFMSEFDQIWVDNLHGDRKIGEYNPDGVTSETVFAIQGSSPGIRIGTAIAALVRKNPSQSGAGHSEIFYRDHHAARAEARRNELLASLADPELKEKYTLLEPEPRIGFPFKPRVVSANYLNWPTLQDLVPKRFPGVKTGRDDFLVDIDLHRLGDRIDSYFDKGISNHVLAQRWPKIMEKASRYLPETIREFLVARGKYDRGIRRNYYRPFDARWVYWDPDTKFVNEKSAEYEPHVSPRNPCLVAAGKVRRERFDAPLVTFAQLDLNAQDGGAAAWPLMLSVSRLIDVGVDEVNVEWEPNLSRVGRETLDSLGVPWEVCFYHCLSTMHSPAYALENDGGLRQELPRIPWPSSVSPSGSRDSDGLREALLTSAELGKRVAALLDSETPVQGVTSGTIPEELRKVAEFSILEGGHARTEDFELTAGWGYRGQGGVVMPGNGMLLREPDLASYTVMLNTRAVWGGVPDAVWEYKLGGYQVLKKWLSYREKPVLGRALKPEEIQHFTETARRIAALIALGPELDSSYRRVAETLNV